MLAYLVQRLCAGLRCIIARNGANGRPCDPRSVIHLSALESFARGDGLDMLQFVEDAEAVRDALSEGLDDEESVSHVAFQIAEAVYIVACFASGEADEDTLDACLRQLEAVPRFDDEDKGRSLALVAEAMGCKVSEDGQHLDIKSLEHAARTDDK